MDFPHRVYTLRAPTEPPPHPEGKEREMEPSHEAFYDLYNQGLRAGLTPEAAGAFATLSWWGLWYGKPAPQITSGRRSRAQQAALYARDPRRAAPPGSSKHESGRAWDISNNGARDLYGFWAPYIGVRWGQHFSSMREPWHFDLG